MQLVLPSQKYKNSFLEALKEYETEGYKTFIDYQVSWVRDHFEEFLEKVAKRSEGIGLSAGHIPDTQFWLIDNDEYIGNTGVRHTLTDHLKKIGGHVGYDIRPSKRRMGYGTKILELALTEAQKLGITEVLITCDATNVGSKKIIEKNGGILENSVTQGIDQPDKMRYWIQVGN